MNQPAVDCADGLVGQSPQIGSIRQLIASAGDGAVAADSAEKYLSG